MLISLLAEVDRSSGSYAAGKWVGRGLLILVAVGLLLTFTRRDLTWKQKLFGRGKQEPKPPEGPQDVSPEDWPLS